MNTFSHTDGLFTSSGCLSPEALDKYSNKQLSAEELPLVNKHIASCSFCKDAVEGALQVQNFTVHSQLINERLRRRFRYIPGRRSRRSPALSNFLIPVAASVIVLVGIIAWFQYFYPEKQELAVVMDTIPVQAGEIEIHEKSGAITESEQPAESTTVGGVFAEEEDISEVPPPPEADKGSGEPVVSETPLVMVAVDDDQAEAANMDEAYDDETEVIEQDVELAELEEEAASGYTELNGAAAKKSVMATRQKESQDVTYQVVEQMPEFPGGMDSLDVFIKQNIKLPDYINIKGKVYAEFTITKKGKVKDVKILRGLGIEIDKEVIRVLQMMPDWKPGMQRGNAVDVAFTLPINF